MSFFTNIARLRPRLVRLAYSAALRIRRGLMLVPTSVFFVDRFSERLSGGSIIYRSYDLSGEIKVFEVPRDKASSPILAI